MKFFPLLGLFGALLSQTAVNAAAPEALGKLDIPYERFVLDNGLTVLVHEDRKAPIVAVNIWYHVGSKNEKPGRTGFAHLFEHLMFNGSENFNDDYFQALERIGATDLNGTTAEDRTNYFEDAPSNALDTLLWLESDRMGHLVGVINQARLDEQRGVVQNEKREGENQPYGKVEELIVKSTWPTGHPYSWTVIGSMEDLNAASLADVKEWFATYYGAANAVIVLAGDIDAKTAREKAQKYFGDIPSGPPLARHEAWIAKRTGSQRQSMRDRVPQARLYKVWNIPPYSSAENDYLEMAADTLARGKASRLYKRLVFQDQIASDVGADVQTREIAGQFMLTVTARPGEDLAKVEAVLNEEFERFLKEGPTETELRRVKAQRLASFIKGAERIGGFGGKSDILAQNEVFAGSANHYKTVLERQQTATPEQIHATCKAWLGDGDYTLEVQPFPNYSVSKIQADRSKMPEPGPAPDVRFPNLQRAELQNGLKVALAERHAMPLVSFQLLVDSGFAADQSARPGAARLTLDLLDEGTATRDSIQISEQLALLGASLGASPTLDTLGVSLSALKGKMEESLAIYADVILHPAFAEADFKRIQKRLLDSIEQEKSEPVQLAMRILPPLLYGKNHAYGIPLTGSGTAKDIKELTKEDARRFHETWFRPNNATLVVVGDTTMEEILPRLEKLFGDWKRGEIPAKNLAPVGQPSQPRFFLIDRPDAIQTIILAGNLTVPKSDPREIAIETANNILGGQFTARLNMNLREDKHWSYGAYSFLVGGRGQRPFLAYASVQTDKTKESLAEMQKELQAILGENPVKDAELAKVKKQQTMELAGSWETSGAIGSSIAELVRYALPDDYFQKYAGRIRSLNLGEVQAAVKEVVHPEGIVWILVGDASKIEAGLRELNFGKIQRLNPDGEIQ